MHTYKLDNLIHKDDSMSKRYDLVGKQFCRLTVISKGDVVKQKTTWHCKCECGNDFIATTSSLNAGLNKSCGCLHKDSARKLANARFIDLTGKRFGRLTVMERYSKIVIGDCHELINLLTI